MSQFLETIQLRDGHFQRLERHQFRMKQVFSRFYPEAMMPSLEQELVKTTFPTEGFYKCRVLYDSKINSIEFHAYNSPKISSLKIVSTNLPSQPYKLADRSGFQALFDQRASCDDVLLEKDGLITDTSYCNVAFFDGRKWFTPRIPLIYGVNRAQLIDEGKIIEVDIQVNDCVNYQKIALFNALNEFGTLVLDISALCF